ncbi:MAG TPA: hypothetical protein VHG31_08370 [Stellaceae bacterium]|nr:hypothetical protein [Stellaceae bacterium]
MNKDEFRSLFLRALNEAAKNAEHILRRRVPHSFLIELHAPDSPGGPLEVDRALDQLYLGRDRFYRVIDVAIRRVLPGKLVAFVRVSGHAPAPFSETWDPSGLGPFKQLVPEIIEQHESIAG